MTLMFSDFCRNKSVARQQGYKCSYIVRAIKKTLYLTLINQGCVLQSPDNYRI